MRRNNILILLIGVVFLAGAALVWGVINQAGLAQDFNSDRAYSDVVKQVDFGPRIPGTQAHSETVNWIIAELKKSGWDVQIIDQNANGLVAHNIVARRGSGGQFIMLGAHYDTRKFADQEKDLNLRSNPVPGANDGASGVAVLLELSRSLPKNLNKQIWLVFFDLEDQGGIGGRNFSEGSQAFAQNMFGNPGTKRPDVVVILDMIGDANLNIYYERNSNVPATFAIWKAASDLGYENSFIPEYRYSMIDDHTPFLQMNIPAVDIIDFDYPYWHTTADTADKVSPESLKKVGETMLSWIKR
jgi:glutaminyl-peptide cyclotransferase